MRPLRYSINVTLDGCIHHEAIVPDAEMHRRSEQTIAWADALIFGRVTYGMMEAGWREVAETGVRPDWMDEWMVPFAVTIHGKKKYVVSETLTKADWNSEIVRGGELERTVRALKAQPGQGLLTGGVKLPLALAELGLIDEYEFVVHPRIVGHGPTLFAGLSTPLDLELVGRHERASGAVEMRYVPKR
jgi:dihydrofolate reductase